jgi:PAS domain S-box-containing protein
MKDHDRDVLSIASGRRHTPGDGPRASASEGAHTDRDLAYLLEELRRLNTELERQNRELRRQHLELAASRDRWCDLWAHAPVGCVLLDRDGRILDANLAATMMLGTARPRLLGRPLTEWMTDQGADALLRMRRAAAAYAAPTACRVHVKGPDGEHTAVDLRAVAVRGEHGRTEWLTLLVG